MIFDTDAPLVLSGGLVIDGSGDRSRRADVLIVGDTIAAIGASDQLDPAGAIRYDCDGLVLAPGFIDVHTHSDLSRLRYPDSTTRVCQGITTEVVGNCGMSPFPVTDDPQRLRSVISTIDVCPEVAIDWADSAGYLARLRETPAATNVAALIGHGSLREFVAERGVDPASTDGMSLMRDELRQALELGAAGLSFGLMYPPGELAGQAELSSLAAEVAAASGLVAVHLRSYAATSLAESVQEMIKIAEPSAVRLQLSHLRSLHDNDAQGITAALATLDQAPEQVQADIYPYLAGHTTALQLFPSALRAQGTAAVIDAAVHDRTTLLGRLREQIGEPRRITFAKTPRAAVIGRRLDEAASTYGVDPAELFLEVFLEARGAVDVIVVGSTEQDMMAALRHPRVCIASDGVALGLGHTANLPHPRSIGTFPRALRALLDDGTAIETAVHKATGQPAHRLGLTDRGVLRTGNRADVVIFDPDQLGDRADYTNPLIPPTGIDTVIVNGTPVLERGQSTGSTPGRLLHQPMPKQRKRS